MKHIQTKNCVHRMHSRPKLRLNSKNETVVKISTKIMAKKLNTKQIKTNYTEWDINHTLQPHRNTHT